MVEPATLMMSLTALEKGVQTGAIGFRQAKRLFRETWGTAFPDYDMEKVFWRVVYGEAIFLLSKVIWHIYTTAKLETGVFLKRPDIAIADFITKGLGIAGTVGLGSFSPIIWENIAEFLGIKGAKEEVIKEIGDSDPIIYIGDYIFNKWWGYIALGIPLFFAWREYKEFKYRKQIREALAIL